MKHENSSSVKQSERLPSMSALLAFEAAANYGSYADAAEHLGRTPSAVSHAIRDMETRFGETLFQRAGRSVMLTRAGKDYLEAVSLALTTLRAATRQLGRSREDHIVKISALPFFTSAILLPNLSRFENDNPQYDLRIETSSVYADILNGEADAAIRFGGAHSENLVCKSLIAIAGQPVVSPKYLCSAPPLNNLDDLRAHTLIHVRANKNAWHSWGNSNGLRDLEGQRGLTFDTILGALDAVKAGHGIALAMDPLIRVYPGYGSDFVPILNAATGDLAEYNFVCRRSNFDDPKIQRTFEWLQFSISKIIKMTADLEPMN